MKKALSLILALMLCLSLCACGGEDNESSKTTEQKTEQETEAIKEEIHTHNYTDWEIVSSPKCVGGGLKKRSCVCGDEMFAQIPATGHQMENNKCVVCGFTQIPVSEKVDDSTIEIDATNGEKVLYDKNNIYIEYCGPIINNTGYLEFVFLIKNNSGYKMELATTGAYINSCNVAICNSSVHLLNETISITDNYFMFKIEDVKKYGITKVEELQLDCIIWIKDGTSYKGSILDRFVIKVHDNFQIP